MTILELAMLVTVDHLTNFTSVNAYNRHELLVVIFINQIVCEYNKTLFHSHFFSCFDDPATTSHRPPNE